MLRQQITGSALDMSGRLVITAVAGNLTELQALAEELAERDGMETDGPVVVAPPGEEPPIE